MLFRSREGTIREAIESAKKERAEAEKLMAEQKAALATATREAAELAKRNQAEVETLRQELAIARNEQRYATLLLFSILELDVYQQTFGSKAAEYCQRMIGTQMLRTLRRSSDLCGRYDDSTLVAAVFGQTPDEAQLLATRIEDAVRGLALQNPRAKLTRQITVESAIVGCPPGSSDDPQALIVKIGRAHV